MAENKQSDIYNVVGKNIKKYRIKKGLKQRELAEALYLGDSFIAKLESITHQTISIDTLVLPEPVGPRIIIVGVFWVTRLCLLSTNILLELL